MQQRIPAGGPAREALRQKGQFWTPDWVAEAMAGYVLSGGSGHLFDPAVGEGAFFRAAKLIAAQMGRDVSLLGAEIDPGVLQQARTHGLTDRDLSGVEIRDFVLTPPSGPYSAIIANPPYIRHHRLPVHVKAFVRNLGAALTGAALDGRAGLHVYFLLRGLQVLGENGRLAFIMPADTCEGVYARTLWRWITRNYWLDAVITFEPQASPFPGVDTNPLIFLIRRAPPEEQFVWARVNEARTAELKEWVLSGFTHRPSSALSVYRRSLPEALATGLSRPPSEIRPASPMLGDYAHVLRGIATGANDFFFLTRKRAASLQIPHQFVVPAVGRTRDVEGDEITNEILAALDAAGRPTLLLSLDGRPMEAFPSAVRDYLKRGERSGVPERPLIKQRRPWYRMETRRVPPFLFAYLGRRNARFIRNTAGVRPLTGFLCVYPQGRAPAFMEKLWKVLRHADTLANLPLVGKSYGSGAIKVEPRALERLPLPDRLLREVGLPPARLTEQ
jgi:hypothetical protein